MRSQGFCVCVDAVPEAGTAAAPCVVAAARTLRNRSACHAPVAARVGSASTIDIAIAAPVSVSVRLSRLRRWPHAFLRRCRALPSHRAASSGGRCRPAGALADRSRPAPAAPSLRGSWTTSLCARCPQVLSGRSGEGWLHLQRATPDAGRRRIRVLDESNVTCACCVAALRLPDEARQWPLLGSHRCLHPATPVTPSIPGAVHGYRATQSEPAALQTGQVLFATVAAQRFRGSALGFALCCSLARLSLSATTRDCALTWRGTAAVDTCGICAGGATGVVPNGTVDCNGDCFGLSRPQGDPRVTRPASAVAVVSFSSAQVHKGSACAAPALGKLRAAAGRAAPFAVTSVLQCPHVPAAEPASR